jgi:hypothetical protein
MRSWRKSTTRSHYLPKHPPDFLSHITTAPRTLMKHSSTHHIAACAFAALTACTGSSGPEGVPGLQGPTGSAGMSGMNGTNGANGADGSAGPAGPSGVLATVPVDDGFSYPVQPGLDPTEFVGDTYQITTTGHERITGTIASYVDRASSAANFSAVLCFRQSGNTSGVMTQFTYPTASSVGVGVRASFTCSGSVIPLAGTWDVGVCFSTSAALYVGHKQGFLMVTKN